MLYRAVFSKEIQGVFRRLRKDKALYRRLQTAVDKILLNPEFGKPLRYDLKNYRRVHVGSYVLVYEVRDGVVFFVDYQHHDVVYSR